MKKKLFKILLFGLLLFIASKAFIAFQAFQVITNIKEQYKNDFLLTYQWVSSTLDGTITVEGVELTPYAMKRTFNLEEVSFHYADYYSLLTNFSALQHGSLRHVKRVSIPSVQSDLKGKSFKEFLAPELAEAWFSPFYIYGCGSIHRLGPNDYKQMGIAKWNASLDVKVEQTETGNDLLTIALDQKEMGRVNLSSEWLNLPIESLLLQKSLQDLKLVGLNLEYQDAGFFRRLNILCNQEDVDKRSIFSANAAIAWKNAMYAQGLLVNHALVELYGAYLMQGGSLSVEASKKAGFLLSNIMDVVNKDLIQYFNMEFKLNGQTINQAELFVDGSILFPPVEEVVVLPEIKEIEFQPGYQFIDIDLINNHLERKIKVTMLDGKDYEGLLSAVTDYNLEVTQNLPGGVVNYPLMLNEIKTIEVWFNKKQ